MQPVMSCQKPIDRPGAEDPLFGLVHLEMNFVPCPVVKTHNSHEDGCSLPGHQGNDRSKGKSLYRRLPHGQAYLLVFTSRHRLITEYLEVMLMMHNGVGLKYSLERCSIPTEVVSSVHQPPVHLVLDEGHQNARDNKPADDLQTKHHIFTRDFRYGPIAAPMTASTEPPSASSSTRPSGPSDRVISGPRLVGHAFVIAPPGDDGLAPLKTPSVSCSCDMRPDTWRPLLLPPPYRGFVDRTTR